MASGARHRRRVGIRWLPLAGLALGLAIGAGILVARSNGSAGGDGGESAIAHVHGLGINPADGRLYVATHHGVFVLGDDGKATRVGKDAQDTMGFTVVSPDKFVASGHPEFSFEPRSVYERPLLGLIESRDSGRTWKTLSLKGEADFHGLVAGHGRIYGWNATTAKFMVSHDGQQWETRSDVALLSFAVDPASSEQIVASGEKGLLVSGDGGRTWQPRPGPAVAFLSWDEGRLWAAEVDGRVFRSTDGGVTWEERTPLPGAAALLAFDGDLYAATPDAEIVRSSDEGRSWRTVYQPS
jgi:hypothetical protein